MVFASFALFRTYHDSRLLNTGQMVKKQSLLKKNVFFISYTVNMRLCMTKRPKPAKTWESLHRLAK